jgi:hypothetical protein
MSPKKIKVGPYVLTKDADWVDPAETLRAPKPKVTTGHEGGTAVDHPVHYNVHPSGVEAIDVCEHMTFNLGNATKYIWRAGLKSESPTEDLKKARWYLDREIARLEKEKATLEVHGQYAFPLTHTVKLGKAERFMVEATPQISMRPRRILSNSAAYEMFMIEMLTFANIEVLVGGSDDAHHFHPSAFHMELELPSLTPLTSVRLVCKYTGKVPKGYKKGSPYAFNLSVMGRQLATRKEKTR